MKSGFIKDNIFLCSIIVSCVIHGGIFLPWIHKGSESSFVKAEDEKNEIYVMLHPFPDRHGVQEHNMIFPDRERSDTVDSKPSVFHKKQDYEFHIEQGGGKEAHEYFALLRERIIRSKQYPKRAMWLKISGKNRVSFFVYADGNVDNIRIVQASGYPVLDRESCNAIKRACPFPPIPSDIHTNQLEMAVSLKYEL